MGEVDGEHFVDRQQGVLIWQLPSIDSSNASGSLEFNCEGEDTEAFFPVTVQFESERLICDVDVSSCFLCCASVLLSQVVSSAIMYRERTPRLTLSPFF